MATLNSVTRVSDSAKLLQVCRQPEIWQRSELEYVSCTQAFENSSKPTLGLNVWVSANFLAGAGAAGRRVRLP